MKSKILLNLTLIAALVALSLYAYFKPWQETAPSIRLTQLKRDDITRIAIEPRGAAAIKLEKLDGAWRIVAPLTAQAESTQVDRLVDIANAIAKQKLSNADLSQFDLNPPRDTRDAQRSGIRLRRRQRHHLRTVRGDRGRRLSGGAGCTVMALPPMRPNC